MKKIIIAPIDSIEQKKNYAIEKSQQQKINHILWKGEVNKKDQENDLFAFLHRDKDQLEVYEISKVLSEDVVRHGWTEDFIKSETNTIAMKPFSTTISFSEFKKNSGYKNNLMINYTKRLRFSTPNIFHNYLYLRAEA